MMNKCKLYICMYRMLQGERFFLTMADKKLVLKALKCKGYAAEAVENLALEADENRLREHKLEIPINF